ncbi:hypothetical protein QPL79_00325 [Ignisphaera sp. 4213-co]|uniref:SWIM-type domain-containing protein n=1 Tax=Ignisphaera cupida TaxID=3050454 RepID=A0ABD4Z3C1_9CREN|nr:hypothetical protein [Ignisphaera sp. 4213-co]MDK6027816.1 hypothetical protein [Ignisphaera sp. 4213-co]
MNRFKNYDKLLEALRNRRFVLLVDKNSGVTINVFKGFNKDYVVSPCRLCTCTDFVIHFIQGKRGYPCYHVIGFYIAYKEQKITKLELDLSTIKDIVLEIALQGFSKTLRKHLSSVLRK